MFLELGFLILKLIGSYFKYLIMDHVMLYQFFFFKCNAFFVVRIIENNEGFRNKNSVKNFFKQ